MGDNDLSKLKHRPPELAVASSHFCFSACLAANAGSAGLHPDTKNSSYPVLRRGDREKKKPSNTACMALLLYLLSVWAENEHRRADLTEEVKAVEILRT